MIVVEHLIAARSKALDDRLVGLRRQSHRVVDVDAAAASAQPDLGPPQADAGPVRSHHPHRFVGPALDHRKAQNAGIEFLGRGQVALLERELGCSADGNWAIARHDSPSYLSARDSGS